MGEGVFCEVEVGVDVCVEGLFPLGSGGGGWLVMVLAAGNGREGVGYRHTHPNT